MSKWDIIHGTENFMKEIQKIKLVQVSGSTVSIVTRSEAKNYLKLGDDTTDDNLIDDLIKASETVIEKDLGGLCICQKQFKQYQQGNCETIELMRQPNIGIPTVSYYDDFETVTASNITYTSYFKVVENELYHIDSYWEKGRDGDGYIITYNAGLFTASDYTSSDREELQVFKTAILRTIAFLYENREEYTQQISEGNWKVTYDFDLPVGIKRLIMPYHTGKGLI